MFGSITDHDSVLNVNNPANYKPIVTCWEVQGKRGCVWVHLGHADTVGDLDAAKRIRRYHKYKVVRVRKAAELGIDPGPWRTIRFKTPA